MQKTKAATFDPFFLFINACLERINAYKRFKYKTGSIYLWRLTTSFSISLYLMCFLFYEGIVYFNMFLKINRVITAYSYWWFWCTQRVTVWILEKSVKHGTLRASVTCFRLVQAACVLCQVCMCACHATCYGWHPMVVKCGSTLWNAQCWAPWCRDHPAATTGFAQKSWNSFLIYRLMVNSKKRCRPSAVALVFS